METPRSFIVIDDDLINNSLCRLVLKGTTAELDIQTFSVPRQGFEYISAEYMNTEKPTILFLDINMPIWTGWDFLDNFEKLDEKIKKQIKIYMLSSSVDPQDMQRAKENKNVVDYIVKPLTTKAVFSILGMAA